MFGLSKIKKPVELEVLYPEIFEGVELVCHTGRHKKEFMKDHKHDQMSISSCYSMVEMQKKSLTFKCWSDMTINVSKDGLHFTTDAKVEGENHTVQGKSLSYDKNFEIFKIQPPFVIRCREPIQFVFCNTPFNFVDLKLPTGITNFYHQTNCNIFFYYSLNQEKTIELNFDDPLAHLVPLTDRRIKLKHTYDDDLHDKVANCNRRLFSKHRQYKLFAKNIPQYWPTK